MKLSHFKIYMTLHYETEYCEISHFTMGNDKDNWHKIKSF